MAALKEEGRLSGLTSRVQFKVSLSILRFSSEEDFALNTPQSSRHKSALASPFFMRWISVSQKHFLAIYFSDRCRWAISKFIGIQCYCWPVRLDKELANKTEEISFNSVYVSFFCFTFRRFYAFKLHIEKLFMTEIFSERSEFSLASSRFYCTLFYTFSRSNVNDSSLIEVIPNYCASGCDAEFKFYCSDLCLQFVTK